MNWYCETKCSETEKSHMLVEGGGVGVVGCGSSSGASSRNSCIVK